MPSDNESPLLTYLLTNEPAFRKARLGALYSDFLLLKTINPDGYTANLQTWTLALRHASLAGFTPPPSTLLTLSISPSLLSALNTRENGRPLSLDTVVHEAVARRDMLGYKEFMAAKESIYIKRWEFSAWSVLGWGLRQLGIGRAGGSVERVVLVGNLEDAAAAFKERTAVVKGRVDRIYARRGFENQFCDLLGEAPLQEGDWGVLLRFLDRDMGLLSYDEQTVKLRSAGEKGITQEDATISSLKTLIQEIEAQSVVLENRIDVLVTQAREAVERKNRISALSALKIKKITEDTLAKRQATLAQLEEVFVKIEQASDQIELVRIMEGSTKVLTGLNKQVGGVKRVDDVVDQLREQMCQVNEVGEVLADQGREGVNETEVDDELEEMERLEGEKQEAEERKAKEEQDRKEAEATRKRLVELEEVERAAAQDKAQLENDAKQADQLEKSLNKSVEDLKRMQMEPQQQHAP
ncbi:Snf7-domain-containing protein [Calycina marina]|uniref:Snf7-domain-containing protein n=1 Tax=Calycina marina TaxID=1763456 RepID=A0A9P7Z1Z2_9HELO|nr:Snf7-domain-containing protein [Calycina marina]